MRDCSEHGTNSNVCDGAGCFGPKPTALSMTIVREALFAYREKWASWLRLRHTTEAEKELAKLKIALIDQELQKMSVRMHITVEAETVQELHSKMKATVSAYYHMPDLLRLLDNSPKDGERQELKIGDVLLAVVSIEEDVTLFKHGRMALRRVGEAKPAWTEPNSHCGNELCGKELESQQAEFCSMQCAMEFKANHGGKESVVKCAWVGCGEPIQRIGSSWWHQDQNRNWDHHASVGSEQAKHL